MYVAQSLKPMAARYFKVVSNVDFAYILTAGREKRGVVAHKACSECDDTGKARCTNCISSPFKLLKASS